MLTIAPHPLLDLRAFVTTFARPLGESPSPPGVLSLLAEGAVAPLHSSETVREAGRAVPARRVQADRTRQAGVEYLLKAVRDGLLAPSTWPSTFVTSSPSTAVCQSASWTSTEREDRCTSTSPRQEPPMSSTPRARRSTWRASCASSMPRDHARTRSRTPSAPRRRRKRDARCRWFGGRRPWRVVRKRPLPGIATCWSDREQERKRSDSGSPAVCPRLQLCPTLVRRTARVRSCDGSGAGPASSPGRNAFHPRKGKPRESVGRKATDLGEVVSCGGCAAEGVDW